MGESETKMGINRNSSVMSDLFESIVGSIYLDGGIKTRKFHSEISGTENQA